jgi:hypothetical protein
MAKKFRKYAVPRLRSISGVTLNCVTGSSATGSGAGNNATGCGTGGDLGMAGANLRSCTNGSSDGIGGVGGMYAYCLSGADVVLSGCVAGPSYSTGAISTLCSVGSGVID